MQRRHDGLGQAGEAVIPQQGPPCPVHQTGAEEAEAQIDGGWQNQLLFDVDVTITSFGQDENGEVYLVSDSGGIFRLTSQ